MDADTKMSGGHTHANIGTVVSLFFEMHKRAQVVEVDPPVHYISLITRNVNLT